MDRFLFATHSHAFNPFVNIDTLHLGGDQSPLNDADADEDNDVEVYLDPDLLGLDDFGDSDKLDPSFTGDIGFFIDQLMWVVMPGSIRAR